MFTLKSPAALNFSWIIVDKDKTDCFECLFFFNRFSAHVTKCFLFAFVNKPAQFAFHAEIL